MSAILFDTETTGVKEPQIIQAAWQRLSDPISLEVTETFEGKFKPTRYIDLGAMATHHIVEEDLKGCPFFHEFRMPADEYVIGHNVDFDIAAAANSGDQPQVKAICTLALARSIWPDLDSHRQTALLYHLDREMARRVAKDAHDALIDIGILRTVLQHIVAKLGNVDSWEALYVASEAARIPKAMAFGKHKGMAVRDLPADYKAWLLRQPDIDPYLIKALKGGAR